MSVQLPPRSVLRNRPMRVARNTVPGCAELMLRAWESIMPSVSVSLPMRLFRCSMPASRSRSSVQSSHVSPPSRLRMTPPTSRPA